MAVEIPEIPLTCRMCRKESCVCWRIDVACVIGSIAVAVVTWLCRELVG